MTLNWFAVYLGKLQKYNYNNYDKASLLIFLFKLFKLHFLPKFAISRIWGYDFCKHELILESTQVVKFSIPTMFTKQLLQISPYKVIIFTI